MLQPGGVTQHPQDPGKQPVYPGKQAGQLVQPQLARISRYQNQVTVFFFFFFFSALHLRKRRARLLVRVCGGSRSDRRNAARVVWRCVAGHRPSRRRRTFLGRRLTPAALPAWWRKTKERRTMTQDRWAETCKGLAMYNMSFDQQAEIFQDGNLRKSLLHIPSAFCSLTGIIFRF